MSSLEQATKAQRVCRGIALPFHDLGTYMGVGGQHHAPAALSPGKARYPLYRRLGGPSRAGLDGFGKSRLSTGIRYPDRPVASPYTD